MSGSTESYKAPKYQGWGTPWWLIRQIEHKFGVKFVLDVAAEKLSAKADIFFSKDDDGLSKHWHKYITPNSNEAAYCNPPYTDIMPWVEQAVLEAQFGTKTIFMLPNRTEVSWFEWLVDNGAESWLLPTRIKFLDYRTDEEYEAMYNKRRKKKSSPAGGHSLHIIGHDVSPGINYWHDFVNFQTGRNVTSVVTDLFLADEDPSRIVCV